MKVTDFKKVKVYRADALPDIDEDFPGIQRDVVKEYIRARYGKDYVCNVGTYGCMKLKTCIKDFGKIKGIPFGETNTITKEIEDTVHEYSFTDFMELATQSKNLYKFVQQYPDLVHIIKYALNQPKSEGVHASAVIITPNRTVDGTDRPIDIYSWMPVKSVDGVITSEWEGKYVDSAGFLKEDILGLSQLDKLQGILNLIKKNAGKTIDLNKIPQDDEEVFKYFRRGWNEDVFQFGTAGLTGYCKQVKPDRFDDLTAMTSLFRPGPMGLDAHLDFANFKTGKKKPKYDVGMEHITEETQGLYAYQEQIMQAVVVGGLSLVESDTLRTSIKKKKIDLMQSFADKFKRGYVKLLEEKHVSEPEKYADGVWDKMMAFSSYGFNKCLIGDEVVYAGKGEESYTIEELYKTGKRGTCYSLTDDGNVKQNKVVDVRLVGKRRCYEVITESGRSIRATLNHKFPTPHKGEVMLASLWVGDLLYVYDGEKVVTEEIIERREMWGLRTVYDVEVSGDVSHTFVTGSGIITSNSHAVAYSFLSYWCQWFKVNYPLEFWTTSLQYAKESEVPYRLSEMKRIKCGIEIRQPDINYSEDTFTCDPEEQRIFFSLGKIKGVGDVAVQNIIKARDKGGKFFSLEEFCERVQGSKVNRRIIISLIIAGAFDELEHISQPKERKKLLRKYLDTQALELPEEYTTVESNGNAFWIMEQKRLTGYGEIDYEPLLRDAVTNKRMLRTYASVSDFNTMKDKTEVTLVGRLIFYKERESAKCGKYMSLQLENNIDVINATLWSDAYKRLTDGGFDPEDYKGHIVAINGVVTTDKFRGGKVLYSSSMTKIYIVQ